jgi:hypothetical protein
LAEIKSPVIQISSGASDNIGKESSSTIFP